MKELTPYQMELLGVLQEECAEVIQIISKIRRFGINSYNPAIPEEGTNFELLNLEVADVLSLIEMVKESRNSPLNEEILHKRIDYKKLKVTRYMRPDIYETQFSE